MFILILVCILYTQKWTLECTLSNLGSHKGLLFKYLFGFSFIQDCVTVTVDSGVDYKNNKIIKKLKLIGVQRKLVFMKIMKQHNLYHLNELTGKTT